MVKSEGLAERSKRGRKPTRLSILSGFFSKKNGKDLNSEKFADDKSRKLVLALAKYYLSSLDPIIIMKIQQFLSLKEKNQEKSKKIIKELSREKKNWEILMTNFKCSPEWMPTLEKILKIQYKGDLSKKLIRIDELCSEIFFYLSKKKIKSYVKGSPTEAPNSLNTGQDNCNYEVVSDSWSDLSVSDMLVDEIPDEQSQNFRERKITAAQITLINLS